MTDSRRKRKLPNNEIADRGSEKQVKFSSLSASELIVELKGDDPLAALKFYLKSGDKLVKMNDFILHGGSVSKLLSLLNGISFEKSSKALIVFRAVQLFIVQVFTSFPDKEKEVVEECRQLLSIHFPNLISMLTSPKSSKEQKISLELLTVIVSCHESLAYDILAHMGKVENKLRELASSADVSLRGLLIQFLMSFIVRQPVGLVRKFLLHSSLLSSIFPGLKNDSFMEVDLVLKTLKSSVAEPLSISKSLKLSVFNTTSIGHLLKLYSWDPTRGKQYDDIKDSDLWVSVRHSLHQLLLLLLTSPKYGVIFVDKNVGLSKQQNALVVNLIANIDPPWGDSLREDLFIKLLSACPGTIKPMYKAVKECLSSSETDVHRAVSFLNKLMDGLELNLESLSCHQKLQFVTTVFVPEFLFGKIKDGLSSADTGTRLVYQKFLFASLSNLNYHVGEQRFSSSLSCLLISKLGDCSEHILKDVFHWASESNLDNLVCSVDCLLIFSKICPQLLDSIKCEAAVETELNLCCEIVKALIINHEQTSHLAYKAYLKLIELRLELLLQDQLGVQYSTLLDELYIHADSSLDVHDLCLPIIRKVLLQMRVFSDPHELEIWMHCLSLNFNPGVLKLISLTLKYTRNHKRGINKMLLLAEETTKYSEEEFLEANLDDYICAMQASEYSGPVAQDQGCSVSPFLTGFCMVLSKYSEEFDDCDDFVSLVLSILLFHQRRPSVFETLIGLLKTDKSRVFMSNFLFKPVRSDSSSSLYSRVSSWLLAESDLEPIGDTSLSDFESKVICHQSLYFLINNHCTHERAVSIFSNLIFKNSSILDMILATPIVLNKFVPLSSSSPAFNSTNLVISLLKLAGVSPSILKPYQKKLSFDLRVSLKNKSRLVKNIFCIMESIPILDSDVKYLIDNIFLSSELLSKSKSHWLIVLMFLLKKATALKIILNRKDLEMLIDVHPYWLYDGTIFKLFSAYLSDYLSSLPEIQVCSIKVNLDVMFDALCRNAFWNEELACTVFNIVKHADFVGLPVDRCAVLLKMALSDDKFGLDSKSVTSLFEEILTQNIDLVKEALISCPVPKWLSHVSYLLTCLKFCCKALKKLCSWVKSVPENLNLCEDSLSFFYSLFLINGKTEVLFELIKKWMTDSITTQSPDLCNHLCNVAINLLSEYCVSSFDDDFCKLLILTAFMNSNPLLLKLLSVAVKECKTFTGPKLILALLSNHSKFLDAMLCCECELKFQLVCLIYELISKDESIMKSSHVAVYLGAYHASLSRCDQMIFLILRMYERSCTLHILQPYVWGEMAVHRYSVREVKTRVDVTSSPTLELIDQTMIEKTIEHFPLNRCLMDDLVSDYEGAARIYDPAFILGVISFVIGPESDIQTFRVIKSRVLSLALVSLNSCDENIRALGYHVLHKFYTSLTNRKNDLIWSNFIRTVHRSVVGERNQRLSGIMSTFMAKASFVITNPAHELYGSLCRYLLAKPIIELDQVPAFLELFHLNEQHQIWIMKVLKDGIRDVGDVNIVLKSFTLKLILNYYSCAMANPTVKQMIEVFIRKIAEKDHRHLLTKEYSLISWLICNNNYHLALQVTPRTNKYLPIYEFIWKKLDSVKSMQ